MVRLALATAIAVCSLIPLVASAQQVEPCIYANKRYTIGATVCNRTQLLRCDGHTATRASNGWTPIEDPNKICGRRK